MTLSLYRRLRSRNQLEIQPIDAVRTTFLELCTGKDIDEIVPESNAYLLHLKSLSNRHWVNELDGLFHAEYELLSESSGKVIQLCSEVAFLIREHGGISISKLVQKLQLKKVLREEQDLCADPFAQSLIFYSLGWLSLLYKPSKRARSNDLKITIQSTKSAMRSNVAAEMVARPLDELLRAFGDIVPRNMRSLASNGQVYDKESASSVKFQVSHLNVATLQDIADMQIVWVDSLSAHLEFDPTIPSLSIFKCPSFCKINQAPDSIATM